MTSPPHADPATEPEQLLHLLAGAGTGVARHIRTVGGRSAQERPWPDWVNPQVSAALHGKRIHSLWSHQAVAAQAAHEGRHVALATGTASGKSLAYQLPMLSALADGASAPTGRGATAIYLAPTKALAADQEHRLRALAIPGVRAATLDGDTPQDERRWIRDHAQLLLTNPDLLHFTLLPQHERWASFFRALRYVIVDECHTYKGVFGSHVALVLRRLRRIAARYKATPTFICASATIAEPGGHAHTLTGLDFLDVTEDGSPRPGTTFALWEPGMTPGSSGAEVRRSAVAESADLMSALVEHGVQTLTFARSRVGVEVVADVIRHRLPDLADSVAAYRGGYLPEERRALEEGLRTGRLRGIAATNALELGIDVSGLDAVLLAGWPGTTASFWQQAGRAGRAGKGSLVVLVAADDPLDTFLVGHPEAVFGTPVDHIVLDPSNVHVLAPHVAAAAAELPVTLADTTYFGDALGPTLRVLEQRGLLRRRPRGWFWTRDDRPTDHVDLRGSDRDDVRIVESRTGRVLGTVDGARSHSAVHAGAVYVHQGRTYVVTQLDLEDGSAHVVQGNPGWSTQARSVSSFELLSTLRSNDWGPVRWSFGELRVTTQVTSFLRRLPSGEVIGEHPLELPERSFTTKGVWWTCPPELFVAQGIGEDRLPGSLHAAEHAAIGVLPLVAPSDRWDVGGVSTVLHQDTGLPTVVVYDGYPGGAGFAEQAYADARRWLTATRDAISQCPCRSGCPSCVQSPKCGNGNEPLDKLGAITVLDLLLGYPDSAAPDEERPSSATPDGGSTCVGPARA